jgi:2-isopropylmalate synthase
VKSREFEGYTYDGAEASFELLARRILEGVSDYFVVDSFRVLVERRFNALGKLVTLSEATVKIVVDDKRLLSVAEGNGPVDALNVALRKDLGKYSEYLQDCRLVDYKVRILSPQAGTGAVTRVMIESADDAGERWSTVGLSSNIIDASFQALIDSIRYKLLRDNAPA